MPEQFGGAGDQSQSSWLARDIHQAKAWFQAALARAESMGDPSRAAHSQNRLGNWYVNMNQPLAGLEFHRAALSAPEPHATIGPWRN